MKLKRFFFDKKVVEVFQDTDWPNGAGFVIKLMMCGQIGSHERSISAEVMMWADDGYWHTLACIPPIHLECDEFEDDFKEPVFKRLENRLDWHNVRDQTLCLLQTTMFYSDHFKPSEGMKDILT